MQRNRKVASAEIKSRMLLPRSAEAEDEGEDTPVQQTESVEELPSEEDIALEQWLRQIPEDPAGLLRRKFMLEHLQRKNAQ